MGWHIPHNTELNRVSLTLYYKYVTYNCSQLFDARNDFSDLHILLLKLSNFYCTYKWCFKKVENILQLLSYVDSIPGMLHMWEI
jgi:hypothetical protein